MASASFKITPLNKENYDTWRIQIEAILVKAKTLKYVTGREVRPVVDPAVATTATAAEKWDDEDAIARSDIILAIEQSELKIIKNCATSKDVWDKLKATYASKGPARKATLIRQLFIHKMDANEDVSDHLRNFADAADKLTDMGVILDDEVLAVRLLYSLPDSFDVFRCAMEARDALPSLENLRIKILEEVDARKSQRDDESSTGAMFARHWRPKGRFRKPMEIESRISLR